MADQGEVVSATEELADVVILLALALLRYNAFLRRRALLHLEELRVEITREVAALDLGQPNRFLMVQALDEPLTALIQAAYQEVDRELRRELISLAGLISDLIAVKIDEAVGRSGIGRKLAAEAQQLAVTNALIDGATISAWLSSQAGNLLFSLRRALNAAASNRANPTELTKAIRETVEAAERHAMPVVRTAVTAVLGTAMVAIVVQNKATLRGYIHVSCLDSKTTETCTKRAGLKWLVDGSPVNHDKPFRVPPLHLGCRSHLTPWFHSAREMYPAAAAAVRAAGREAAFGDRPVVDPELGTWLAQRPVKQQAAIVGKAKLDAWKAGTITTAALLDQSSRPLNIEQIRKILFL
jgi:SPP1 gp7 family putative phage head morphogenesis protein